MNFDRSPGLRSVPFPSHGQQADQPQEELIDLSRGDYLVTAIRANGDIDYFALQGDAAAAELATELATEVGPAGIRVQRVTEEIHFDLVPHWEVHVTGGRSFSSSW